MHQWSGASALLLTGGMHAAGGEKTRKKRAAEASPVHAAIKRHATSAATWTTCEHDNIFGRNRKLSARTQKCPAVLNARLRNENRVTTVNSM